MTGSYDAIIVGAGPNGLVAGAYLARAGRRVAVLEAASADTLAHGHHVPDVLGPAPMLQRVSSELGLESAGCKMEPVDPCMVAPFEGAPLVFSSDPGRTAESIARHSSKDAAAWPAFVDMVHTTSDFLKGMWEAPPLDPLTRDPRELWAATKLGLGLRRLGPAKMKDIMRVAPMSVAELLDDWFESDLLKGALAASAVDSLRQGPMAVGTAFTFLHHHVGAPRGVLRPIYRLSSGMKGLTEALADLIRAQGGTVETDSRVVRIEVESGRASGVITENGDAWTAKSVLSSLDPHSTFLSLLDPMLLETEFTRALRNIRIQGVASIASIALSEWPQLPGMDSQRMDSLLTLAPSIDYVERAFDATKYGEISKSPVVHLRLGLAEASQRPSATALVQYTPHDLSAGDWDEEARGRVESGLRSVLSERLPEFEKVVDSVELTTPPDLSISLGLTGGHLHHGDLTLDQALFMRPVPQAAQYRSPVRDLYLCGAGSHPGGGLHGMPGRNAAAEVLLDQKRGSFGAKNQL